MMGGSPIVDLMGIFVGHCYVFLKDVLPSEYENIDILKTPKLFCMLFPNENAEQENNIQEEVQDLIAQEEQHQAEEVIPPPEDVPQQEPAVVAPVEEEIEEPVELSRQDLAELRRRRFEAQK
jgi:Derlin-2/3